MWFAELQVVFRVGELKENSDMAEKDYRQRYTNENCCTPQDHSFANEKQKHCLK